MTILTAAECREKAYQKMIEAKSDRVLGKKLELKQAKPLAPLGCKLVGTVKGTKLWAGDCTGSAELRGSATATETGVIPPGQKQ
jgi:hypothetical protein